MTSTWNPPATNGPVHRTCAEEGCFAPTAGQSKYCKVHRAESRQRFKAMVSEQSAQREARDATFALVYAEAVEAGRQAAEACTPTPMIVQEHASPLDDSSPVIRTYEPVMDGVCGFAWVTIRPGNCAFANWAKKHAGARKAYYGGVEIWIHAYGQSYERKRAHAQAMANVIRERLQVAAYPGSRLD